MRIIQKVIRYAPVLINYHLYKSQASKTKLKNSKPEVLLVSLPKATPEYPPLGLAYLSSYLRKKGISCTSIDFNQRLYELLKSKQIFNTCDATFVNRKLFEKFSDEGFNRILEGWVAEILQISPSYLGISTTSYLARFATERLITKIRSKDSKIKIILGGPGCTFDADRWINGGFADFVCKGEGMEAFYSLITNSREKKVQNKIIEKEPLDLNSLPFPDFSDFPLEKYKSSVLGLFPKLPIVTSLGCKGFCKFCNIKSYWPKYSIRKPDNVLSEMLYQKKKHGVFRFCFHDSMINSDLVMLEKFCDLILQGREKFFWTANLSLWKPLSQNLYNKLAKSGCIGLYVGIESGSEDIRKDMRKPITDMSIEKQLVYINHAGIDVHASFIIGYPTETKRDFKKSMNFIMKNKQNLTTVNFGLPCLLGPGTYLSGNYKHEGIEFDNNGIWFYKDNTIQERVRRWQHAVKVCQKKGLLKYSNTMGRYVIEFVKSSDNTCV